MNVLKSLNKDSAEQMKFSEHETDLYNALIDEYNDSFEDFLTLKEHAFFDKILRNVSALFGEKKMSRYSKISIGKIQSTLKIQYYMVDLLQVKNLRELINALGSRDKNQKISVLNIDDIFSHCEKCSKCYHVCGEELLKPDNYDYIICLKCKKIYKPDLIRLYCKECSEEYYSYIIPSDEEEYEGFIPATWDKYHCKNYIYEEMECPKCTEMLYFDEEKTKIKCFHCKFESAISKMKWTCNVCGEKFTSGVKDYIRLETQPLRNCIKYALVNNRKARPLECKCCKAEPRLMTFTHGLDRCKGTWLLGKLQDDYVAVCSECREVCELSKVLWKCPKCKKLFHCNEVGDNISGNHKEYVSLDLNKNSNSDDLNSKKIGSFNVSEQIAKGKSSEIKDSNLTFILKKKIKDIEIKDNIDVTDVSEIKDLKDEKLESTFSNRKSIIFTKYERGSSSRKITKSEEGKILTRNYNNTMLGSSNSKRAKMNATLNDDDCSLKKASYIHVNKMKNYYGSNEGVREFNILNESASLQKTKYKSIAPNKLIKPILTIRNSFETMKTEQSFSSKFNNKLLSHHLNKHFEGKNYNNISCSNISSISTLKSKIKPEVILNYDNIKINRSRPLFNQGLKSCNTIYEKSNKNINFDSIDNMDEKLEEEQDKFYSSEEEELSKKLVTKQIKHMRNSSAKSIEPGKKMERIYKGKLAESDKLELKKLKSETSVRELLKSKLIRNFDRDNGINLNLNLNININNFVNNTAMKCENKNLQPDENFVPEDFVVDKQIGEGTFGKIYCVTWVKNKKKYAMKKLILKKNQDYELIKEKIELLTGFEKKNSSDGVIKLYGAQCQKHNEAQWSFHVLMELAEGDWEKEIKLRSDKKNYYSEGELLLIMKQLVSTYATLQKCHITHRDVKPQNILLVNGVYKVCDFGEAKDLPGKGDIKQAIRGTELYMSPVLFNALNHKLNVIVHNSFKSDVFSLGMCLLLAGTLTFHSLYNIRELKDNESIKNVLVRYMVARYSYKFIGILLKMLELDETKRPDFIELEKICAGI